MDLKKKSKEGLKWSFVETVGVRLFSVSTYFILAKLLDPTAFGLVALTSTFIFFSEVFVEQGFVAALVQKAELEASHLSSAFWGNLFFGGLLFVLTYLCAPFIASIYDEPLLGSLLRVHALTYIVSSFAKVHLALLQREMKFKKIAIANTTAIVVSCITSLILAYQGYGAWSLVFQQVIFNLLQTILLWFLYQWRPNFELSWQHYRDVFSFGSKIMMNRFAMSLIRYTDALLIGYFLGTGPLGYYSFAQKIFVTLTDLVNLTFSKVLFSVFSMLQNEREKLAREFYKFADLMASIAFPLFAMAFAFTPHAVPLLFGEKWVSSILTIQIFSIAGVLVCFYSCFNNLLPGIGKAGLNLRIKLTHLAISLVLVYIAVQFSVEAVAATHIAGMTIILIVMIVFARKFIHLNVRRYLVSIIKPFPVSLLIVVFVYTTSAMVEEVTLPVLIVQGLVSVSLCLGYLVLTKPNMLAELKTAQGKKGAKVQ